MKKAFDKRDDSKEVFNEQCDCAAYCSCKKRIYKLETMLYRTISFLIGIGFGKLLDVIFFR